MIQFDPRNKLELTHMVLYSLMNDRTIDKFTIENAKKEIDEFTAFLLKNDSHPIAFKIIKLLSPGLEIIEFYLENNFCLSDDTKLAYSNFNEAVDLIGKVIRHEISDDYECK